MRTHSFKVLITSSWDIKTFKPMRIQLHIKIIVKNTPGVISIQM